MTVLLTVLPTYKTIKLSISRSEYKLHAVKSFCLFFCNIIVHKQAWLFCFFSFSPLNLNLNFKFSVLTSLSLFVSYVARNNSLVSCIHKLHIITFIIHHIGLPYAYSCSSKQILGVCWMAGSWLLYELIRGTPYSRPTLTYGNQFRQIKVDIIPQQFSISCIYIKHHADVQDRTHTHTDRHMRVAILLAELMSSFCR